MDAMPDASAGTRAYRAAVALAAATALVIQYGLFLADEKFSGPLAATIAYASYFTMIGNAIGAVVMGAPAFIPDTPLGRFCARPDIRTAATLYLIIVGVVYHSILAAQWDPKGWMLFTDIVFHTVTPLAVALDWLFLTQKRSLNVAMTPPWLIVPVLFGAWTLGRGAATGSYPYPFLKVPELGYPAVMLNMAGLLAAFALTSVLLVVIGRRISAIVMDRKDLI
jgi:hypothetical protein